MNLKQGRTFVMGDIHGAYLALRQCLERSGFDYQKDTLIQLGDVVDGYGESFETVEELLKIKNLISIIGNHDAWFAEFIQTDFHPYFWNYGGEATIRSYLAQTGKLGTCFRTGTGFKTSLNSSDIPPRHRKFFNSQKLYYIDEKGNCFVHAGFKQNIPFSAQEHTEYYWNRKLWEDAIGYKLAGMSSDKFEMATTFTHIFLGHSSTTNWESDKPLTAMNITNLDTGAGHSGRLTIMDIETREYWQSDKMTEIYTENLRA